MAWDFIRNEPVTEENTAEQLHKLSRLAQQAKNAGDTLRAAVMHDGIDRELDTWNELHGR
ncbi:hypothetical protein [Streptomyces rimosus]|uniref:hypothetical protein n=1 Tax=Streptomyces rimosus TaxID=1927 RepID=UPI0037D0D4B3